MMLTVCLRSPACSFRVLPRGAKPALIALLAVAALLAGAPGARAAEQTFNYTGAQQTFVVPAGATAVKVVATGASGGFGYEGRQTNVALGVVITATIPVTATETLAIFVGGKGGTGGVGGFNGGGSSADSLSPGGGGGGASDVRQGGTTAIQGADYRVVVAGGGGGNGSNYPGIDSLEGGAGGAPMGQNGIPSYGGYVAYGGTQTAGGASGGPDIATAGTLGKGGTGGGADYYGGGGGGGYYGGGGGFSVLGNAGGGGGGGSSFATPLAIGTVSYRYDGPGGTIVSQTPTSGKIVLSFSGATVYWSGTGSGTVAGGSGTWDTTNGRWSTTGSGSSYAVWVNSLPDDAVFQNTAGTVTVGTGVTVKSLTFGVSGYTLSGANAITLTDTGTIATGTSDATISAPLAGTAGLTKTGAGTLTLTGANTYSGATTISAGTISINNSSGSAFGTDGVTVASGATLKGSGSFTGPLTLVAGATLSPGNSPGLMTIGSGSMLSGTTLMELAGLSRGTTYDAINVSGAGTITFGGTLQVTLTGGFSPVSGNSFNLFSFTTGSSTFATLDLPALTAGLVWDQTALYTSGTLSVSAIPEPSTYAAIFGVGALGFAAWRRRAARVAYQPQ